MGEEYERGRSGREEGGRQKSEEKVKERRRKEKQVGEWKGRMKEKI